MKKNVLLFMIALLPLSLSAQFDGIVGSEGCKALHCDDVRFVEWATGCNVMRGYMNIALQGGFANYGEDDAAIGKVTESTTECVSLGDGGKAVLTFQTPIANGAGYDFAVFENSLNDTFLELAFVEVSSDGENYFRFPAVSNTQTATQIGGFGTLDATKLHNLAGKHRAGWGTPFDLDDLPDNDNLDKNNVRFVRIVDVVGAINPDFATYDSQGNIVNDPYPTDFASSGFDLSGVGVINNQNNLHSAVAEIGEIQVSVFPNPCVNTLFINASNCNILLYNALGQQLQHFQSTESLLQLNMSDYSTGVYFIELQTKNSKKVVKIIKQ